MRSAALALAVVLAVPSVVSAQDRKEVRLQPMVGTLRVAEVPDGEIAPIAEAIRRGDPASRIEADWKTLVERHAAELDEDDASALTLRMVGSAWEPMEAELDRGLADLRAGDRCDDQARAIARHRDAIEHALGAGENAGGGDIRRAAESFEALSNALASCEEALSTEAVRRDAKPVGTVATGPREPVEIDAAPRVASVRTGVVAARAGDEAEDATRDDTEGEIGDDAQLFNVDLQNWLQEQQQVLQMMSNVAKSTHDTAMGIIRNMK